MPRPRPRRWRSAASRLSSPIFRPAALLKAADARRLARSAVLQCRRDRRPAARGGLPRQCHSYRADALDAGRCTGAVSGLEAVAPMVAGRRLPSPRTSSMPMRCGAPPSGSAHASFRRRSSRTPAARAGPTAASSRSSANCRYSRKARRPTMCWSPRTRARCSPSYLPYRTWDARPVAGSAGLVPTSWDASHDQWGAVQMQNRFMKLFSRRMTARDMQAWTAARMIGESASRTRSSDPKAMFDFLKGPDFALAAFKGQRLTLRDWNLQLRQPILLTDGRMVVSVSPQEGFLHQFSELDTLGLRSARKQMQAQVDR